VNGFARPPAQPGGRVNLRSPRRRKSRRESAPAPSTRFNAGHHGVLAACWWLASASARPLPQHGGKPGHIASSQPTLDLAVPDPEFCKRWGASCLRERHRASTRHETRAAVRDPKPTLQGPVCVITPGKRERVVPEGMALVLPSDADCASGKAGMNTPCTYHRLGIRISSGPLRFLNPDRQIELKASHKFPWIITSDNRR